MTTKFQELHPIGTKISGQFSNLPFSGTVSAHIAECIVVTVDNPHENLPIGVRGLCFHPDDTNVVIDGWNHATLPNVPGYFVISAIHTQYNPTTRQRLLVADCEQYIPGIEKPLAVRDWKCRMDLAEKYQ